MQIDQNLKLLDYHQIKEILEQRFINYPAPKLADLPKPHLFCDMKKAAYLIAQAIKSKQKIALVGDYDVDGVVSCVIFAEFFKQISYPLYLKIPNRFNDGYGISVECVEELHKNGIELIITVDNGINAFSAALKAKELGIKLIISDHHEPSATLPEAYAIVDPKRKDCDFFAHSQVEICGAQVAWYLCAALKQELNANVNFAQWFDILALAISADMMPMRGLNQSLMRAGLQALNTSNKPFILALKHKFNKNFIDYENISFLITPLLNSSGRMNDAKDSFEFLCASTYEEALKWLDKICEHNNNRKLTEALIYEEAKAQINENDKVILSYKEGWNKGVIGIVAGRLANNFARSSIVLSIENNIAQGSARAFGDCNLLQMFEYAKDILIAFGGHKSAAGLSCEANKLELLKQRLEEYACDHLEYASNALTFGWLDLNECNLALYELLSSFEPFGTDNEKPIFSSIVKVKSIKILKNKHLKLLLEDALNEVGLKSFSYSICVDAIYFNYTQDDITANDILKIDYQISKNDFYSPPKIQLIISDMDKINK